MNIRTKAILSVLLIISLLSAIYLTLSISHQRQDLNDEIHAKKRATILIAQNLQKQAFAHYRTRIVSLATTKHEVIEAFAKRDRAQLQKTAVGFYNVLKKENPYFRTMQFNLPDGTAFLRMHLPDFHGDNISSFRPIIPHVHSTQKQASGYDIGRSGLYYRVVQPMFYQGEYIGSIGFGIKYVQLLELLHKDVSSHVAIFTSASKWQTVNPARWQKMGNSSLPVIQLGENVILPQGSKLFADLPLSGSTFNDEKIHFHGEDFLLFSNITLNDYQNMPVAKVLVALDITNNLRNLKYFIAQISLITLGLLALTAIVLHISFGQLLDTILNLNNSLSKANEELEERVQHRTAELVRSNLALQKEMEERQHIEIELRQAEKMRAIGTLASGIAHDFNNILTAILGFTQLTLQKLPPDHDISINLGKVEKAGMRAKDLVAQILAFSRQSEHKKQAIRLHPIIQEALKLLRATIPANINIVQNIDTECCPTLADPSQIHQVLMNLCTNSYHAMSDSGGQLTVTLSQIEVKEENSLLAVSPGLYLQIDVSDTGSGMDASTLDRIFEPYFTTKELGKGTGLGLAVVHGIVKNASGNITVQSILGQGTTFTIVLPCYHGEDSYEEQSLNKNIVMGNGEHLLVIEDENEILLYWEILLKEMGYQVTAMSDSTTAYQWLVEHVNDIDGIITDMSMPKMTGLELSRKIKELAPNIPIALCSGFTSTDLQEKAQKYGVTTFIKKPVDNILLSHILRTLLS